MEVLRAFSQKCIWLALVSTLVIAGCASTGTYDLSKPRIKPLSNQSTILLDATDIVQMMRQVGFSDGQIREFGASVRDSLLNFGAVELEINKKIEAIFAVKKELLYIATRSRGSFVYDAETGQIVSTAQEL